MDKPHIVQRAFELAPRCGSLDELRSALKGEGYTQVEDHLKGPSIQAQLKQKLTK